MQNTQYTIPSRYFCFVSIDRKSSSSVRQTQPWQALQGACSYLESHFLEHCLWIQGWCYPTFPTPLAIEPKQPPPKTPISAILWDQMRSTHLNWISVCSAVEVVCVFNVPVSPCSPLSPLWEPSQSLSACSFIRKTDTPSFYDWRAAINTLPSPQTTPHSPNMGAGKLSGARPLWPFKDPLPAHTVCLPAFTHLVQGCSVSAQHLSSSSSSSWLLLWNILMEKDYLYLLNSNYELCNITVIWNISLTPD